MKRITTIILALLIALTGATTVSALEVAPIITTTLLSYQPLPAQPGDLLDVYIQLSNDGRVAAEDVEVGLVQSGSLAPEGQTVIKAGTIAAQSAYVAKFKVRVSPDAVAGERLLTVYTKQLGSDRQERTVTITVQSDYEAILITGVKTNPATIEPGKTAEASIEVENQNTARLRDVTIELNLDNTPFVPVGSSSRKKIGSLDSKKTLAAEYELSVDPAAEANVYSIPVSISFLDEQGNEQEQTDIIGLRVNTETITKAYLDETTWSNNQLQVAIRIVNKGLSEIKFVELTAEEGDKYHIKPQDREVYVGNIDSDDWETVRINVETTENNIELPISYTFRDTYNEEYTVSNNFAIEVPYHENGSGVSPWVAVIAILVVVAGIFWWRKRRKARTSKK